MISSYVHINFVSSFLEVVETRAHYTAIPRSLHGEPTEKIEGYLDRCFLRERVRVPMSADPSNFHRLLAVLKSDVEFSRWTIYYDEKRSRVGDGAYVLAFSEAEDAVMFRLLY